MSFWRGLVGLAIVGGFAAIAVQRLGPAASPASEESVARGPVAPIDVDIERVPAAPRTTREPEPEEVASVEDAGDLARDNNRAIEELNAGRLDEAIALFEACVEGDPDSDVFRRNLAEALARRAVELARLGDEESRAAAIADLTRAIELNPDREDLAELLERLERSEEAERDFWRKLTEHFELSFDGTRDELMWGTAPLEHELEAAYHELGEFFGTFPVEEGRPRIRVVLYRREAFQSVTGLGDWAGGAFDGTVRVPVRDLGAEVARLKEVLRHELAHAFIHEVGGTRVPGWLNEGLAQLLEPVFRDERLVALRDAERKLAGRDLFPLSRLEGSLASWPDASDIERAYAQSLAFVAYIERMFGERVLVEMVEGCKRGRAPAATFTARTGDALGSVLEDLARGL